MFKINDLCLIPLDETAYKITERYQKSVMIKSHTGKLFRLSKWCCNLEERDNPAIKKIGIDETLLLPYKG